MSLQSGAETLAAGDLPAAGGSAPAWLHLVVAWSLALVCVVFVGVLALLHDAIPTPLLVIGGASIGGALGLTNPLTLTRL